MISSAPTSTEPSACWRKRAPIGRRCRNPIAHRSASSMSRPTKFMVRSGRDDPAFCETTPYAPNSPYSASKAASDHLVRAYHHTYGLPVLTTNCSNNYGPYQFPEKLIPLMILNACAGKPLPVYGDGQNVRDWLYVEDHCRAIRAVLAQRPRRRDLQHRRPQRKKEPRYCRHRFASCWTNCVRTIRWSRTASSSHSSKIVPATTAATPWTRARSSAN